MRALRILAKVLGGLLTLVVTLVAALFVFLQTSSGQRALAGRRLQEGKQQPQPRNQAAKDNRREPERAHQKACPRLT